MKRIILIIIASLAGFITLMADTPVDLTEIPDVPEDTEPVDPKNRGRRTSPAPIRCLIDFEALTLTSQSPKLASITEYQLWSSDGLICLAVVASDHQFVATLLSQLPGEYLMILKGPSYSLCGYVVL